MLFTGSTVEEAIQAGLRELQIPRHKAHITVVAREKKGFLGIGKKPAQVEVEAIKETTVQKADQQAVRGVPDEVNQKNAPVKSVSEETRDLSRVVAAVKKAEKEGELVDEDVKAQILKNDKPATTILEETGQTAILQEIDNRSTSDFTIQEASDSEQKSSELVEQISTEPSYKVETVASEVSSYLQTILDGMDVEAELDVTHSHRSISVQVETNEPGRVIGYHGKVLKALQLLAQNYIYNNYARNFYITVNVNDYAEHRAEVLQGYAQKVVDKVLETGSAYHTDPMSNNERKMIHRIVSKIDGVTSYSEGNEPHRYVVIDVDGQDI
ncbi:RNA-binding cell elongation regulator Jag/EloR [Streptococcus moroccensis]|uniref:RNA-binding protein KhpB n=1 Tax=Streptococcus moroccensis TaxID=1451356 RepID=A0ABT9YS28_9STRE|nr:RNA-binding cell elongation regulator Jag/EloR [Streptococcus moroccensis]MDQ0222791.1 spoIIIJ-associated protein [Streptococcus moroccensis]